MTEVINEPIVNKEKSKRKFRLGFLFSGTFLTFVLIILKAFEIVEIEWLWVFAPLWIPTAIIILIIIIAFAGGIFFKKNLYKF